LAVLAFTASTKRNESSGEPTMTKQSEDIDAIQQQSVFIVKREHGGA
jgi:hypothetical protein